MDARERARRRSDEYLQALEHERRKIEVFQRELPLCLHLVTTTIESLRRQVESSREDDDDVAFDAAAVAPVLEEFIPLKPSSCDSMEEEEEEVEEEHKQDVEGKPPAETLDWLRSVQLWNHHDSLPTTAVPAAVAASNKPIGKNTTGAFQPFENTKNASPPPPHDPAISSLAAVGEVSRKQPPEGQSPRPPRKLRRCWSPDLHHRFLHALHQLGGPHAATPKHIRELMKVDSLTNDEVKSHLQKYRMHSRRSPVPVTRNGSSWMQPSHNSEASCPANGIAVPVPLLQLPSNASSGQQLRQEDGREHHRESTANSPTASSTSQTSTVSPAS